MNRIMLCLVLSLFVTEFAFGANSNDEKKINKIFSELKGEGDLAFATNVKNTLSNIYCGKEVNLYPQYVLACDYSSNDNKRKDAKCYLINNGLLKIVATAAVVYGQGGVAEPKDFKIGKNQTPLGAFDISKPENREHRKTTNKNKNEFNKSEIAKILKSDRMPAMTSQLEGLGPIFYPEEEGGFGSSLGSPVFFGSSAKNILSLLKESKKTLLFNSAESTSVKSSCN